MHTETCNLLRHKYFGPMDYISGVARGTSENTRPGSGHGAH